MKIFALSYRQRKNISRNNVIVYSYDAALYDNNKMKKIKIPTHRKIELLFRKLFLDDE